MAGGEHDLGAWLDVNEAQRREAATARRAAGDMDGYLELRLWESVAQLEAGRVERAFRAIREVWVAVDGRIGYTPQALVLTQLAACCKARGDLRGGIRAARRAEALIVAEAGDSAPCVLAVRGWLLSCVRERGEGVEPIRQRLEQTLAGLTHTMRGDDARARLDRMRSAFVEANEPRHWALVHLMRWRCVAG